MTDLNNDTLKFDPEALDEKAVYRATVQAFPSNPPHAAILITGFSNGAYAKVVGPSFHEYHPSECYKIEIHEKLCDLPDHGAFEDAEALDSDEYWENVEHSEFPMTQKPEDEE